MFISDVLNLDVLDLAHMAKMETAKTAVLSLHAVPRLGEAPESEGPLPRGVSTLAEQPLVPPLL